MRISINKKFESKKQMLDWLVFEMLKKGVQAGALIFQENSIGSKKLDQYSLKGHLVEM